MLTIQLCFKSLRVDTDIDDINMDLQTTSDWAAQWRVTFNASKSECMLVSKKIVRPAKLPVNFNGTEIKYVSSHCHLGIWLTESMSWDKQIIEINKKSAKSINLLKRLSYVLDRKTKLFLYKSYIRPLLEYNTCLYDGNLTKGQSDALEATQRQALLCATNAYRHTSHERLLLETGIEPLNIRRKYFSLCHLYRIINGLTPTYLADILPPYVGDSFRYPLRNAHNFLIPKTRKNYVRLSFFWRVIEIWNSMSLCVRESPSLASYKVALKAMFFYKHSKFFDLHTPKASVHHARMRMGLSALNAHRKKFNFIDFNHCPYCGQKPEDPVHFFLKCPYHAIHRTRLVGTIHPITITKIPNLIINPASRTDFSAFTNLLLFGSELLSFDENIAMFKAVHEYIYRTKRFEMG